MQITIKLEQEGNGLWVASVPQVLGAMSQGQTRKSAIENLISAMSETSLELAVTSGKR